MAISCILFFTVSNQFKKANTEGTSPDQTIEWQETWPNTKFSHREFIQKIMRGQVMRVLMLIDVGHETKSWLLNPKKAFNLPLMNICTSHCTHLSTNSVVTLLENAIHHMHSLLYCAWWVCCPQSKSYLTLFQMDDQSFLALWKKRSKQIIIKTVMSLQSL